jgi:selenocysteine-specific elongation factor
MAQKLDTQSIFNVIIGTAGHIDHGKSSLVKRLTGIDPDRLPEEQKRGMTIDLGFAPLILKDGRHVGIIDVPGHERFVKNMVAGATSIDFVLLVVAVDDGVMPQTYEHLNIMRLLGIARGIIVLNKIDVVEKELTDLVEEDARKAVSGTFLEKAPLVRVSCATGEGIPALLDMLDELLRDMPPRGVNGVFRMPIQRVFSAKGFGTIVTGVPIDGSLAIGESVEVLPQGLKSRVRGLQAYKSDVVSIQAGHSSAVNLADIVHDAVQRGNVIALPGYLKPATIVEALLRFSPDSKMELRNRTPVRLHTGTSEVLGRISLLDHDVLRPGDEGLVQFLGEEPFVTAPGDHYIVRLQSPMMTLGGGRIISCGNARLRRLRADVNDSLWRGFGALDESAKKVEFTLRRAGVKGLSPMQAAVGSLVRLDVTEGILRDLSEKGVATVLAESGRFVHREAIDERVESLKKTLATLHQAAPLAVGFPEAELKRRLQADSETLRTVISAAQAKRLVKEERGLLSLDSHKVMLSEEQRWIAAEAERVFEEAAYSPPGLDEVVARLKSDMDRFRPVLNFLLQAGSLVAVAPDIIFHRNTIEAAREKIVAMIDSTGELATAAFRDAVATTRKYTVPLLEYFDKIGLTVRDGNIRKIAPERGERKRRSV